MKKKFLAFLTLMIVLLTAGCSSGGNEGKIPDKIVLGSVSGAPPNPEGLILSKTDILEKAVGKKVNIELIPSRDANWVIDEWKKNRFDLMFVYMGVWTEYISNTGTNGNGSNYKLIALSNRGPDANLIAQPGIKSIKDLDGKTVGIWNTDYAREIVLANTLKQNGLDLTSRGGTVKSVKGPSQQILDDFTSGKLDALVCRPTYYNELTAKGFPTLVKWPQMAYDGAPVQILVVRKDFAEKYPEFVVKFIEAQIEAQKWFKENMNTVTDWGYQYREADLKARNETFASKPRPYYEKQYKNLKVDIYPNLTYYNDLFEFMNLINEKKPFPMEEVVDFSYLEKALKNKGMKPIEGLK